MDAAATTSTSTDLAPLESKIQALRKLNDQIEALRQVPSFLLRTPSLSSAASDGLLVNNESPAARLKGSLDQLKEFTEKIRSDDIQEALVSARDSERKDKTGLELNHRRHDTLKHR